jgi:hypothetical protein
MKSRYSLLIGSGSMVGKSLDKDAESKHTLFFHSFFT